MSVPICTPLLFDEATHTYTMDGAVIPSVTQILKPLYEGAFDFVNPDVLEAKRQLGQAVHKATEFYDLGVLDESSVHPMVRPRLDAWIKFRRESGFVPEKIEERVYHAQHGYAGTLDRIGTIGGKSCLLDIKTVATLHPAVGVQLAAYETAYVSSLEINDRQNLTLRAICLRDDGTYALSPVYTGKASHIACFLSLLTVARWKESNHV